MIIRLRNSCVDDGKFQCRFENGLNNGEVDIFNILILFIVFEVESVFLLIIFYGIIYVVLVILVIIIFELFGEMI